MNLKVCPHLGPTPGKLLRALNMRRLASGADAAIDHKMPANQQVNWEELE